MQLGLEGTDDRVHDDKSVTPTFLFAVLLWPAILRALGTPDGPLPEDPQRLLDASDKVIGRQLQRIALPKRFSLPMRELIMLQTRFERRSGRRALRLLEHPRFRAAYDFLLLRAESGEADPELAAVVDRPAGRVGRRSARDGREPSAVGAGRSRQERSLAPAAASASSSQAVRAGTDAVTAGLAPAPAATAKPRWVPAYVALGSNLADPRARSSARSRRSRHCPQTRLVLRSSLYRSRPHGAGRATRLRQCRRRRCSRSSIRPRCCGELKALKRGSDAKRPVVRWGPRLIDLDLLVHGRPAATTAALTLPHPGIAERDFVLVPLAEISPSLDVPGVGRVDALLQRLAPTALERILERIDA